MKSSSDLLIDVTVHAADESTEIFVVDGRFRRVADGVGRVKVPLRPGLYTLRFRAGDQQVDQLVEVHPDPPTKEFWGEPVHFEAAAPIENTVTTRRSHAASAEELSRARPEQHGEGSGLFIFARDVDERSRTRPWTGIGVRDLDGNRVADLKDGELSADDGFAALHLELDPGTYRLRVETGDVGTYEMFVKTAEGWQTQVFTLAKDFWSGEARVRRAGLRNASVFMTRDAGFHATDEQVRLTELARQGLASGRRVVRPADLNKMLWMKYENPMIAIYAAHLLLLHPPVDHTLIKKVLHNLARLVPDHPDVLALHLRSGAGTPPSDLQFPSPPMLRRSWDLISRATRRRSSLVPAGSATDLIADELLDSHPWLLHRIQGRSTAPADESQVSVASGARMLSELVDRATAGEAERMAQVVMDQPERFSALEQNLAAATIGPAYLQSSMADGLPSDESDVPAVSISQVIRDVEAPASSIARSAKSLVEKLGEDLGEDFREDFDELS